MVAMVWLAHLIFYRRTDGMFVSLSYDVFLLLVFVTTLIDFVSCVLQ